MDEDWHGDGSLGRSTRELSRMGNRTKNDRV